MKLRSNGKSLAPIEQQISQKVDKAQGASYAGKALIVGNDGNVALSTEQLGTNHYGVMWNKVTATMTRLGNAAGFTTTTTDFGHNGSVNTSKNNPFDSCYPWSGRTLCNIDIDAYLALEPGDDITDCITAYLGEPGFSYTHADGVWVYTPEFWGKTWDDGVYRYFDIADKAVAGYTYYRAQIIGRWHGTVATRTIAGTSKTILLPKAGMPAKNVAMSTMHGYAKNAGMTLDNIYSIDGETLLFIIEYATMNSQTALGNGASDLYSQSGYTIQANATASAVVQVLTSQAENCIAGAIFDIGTSDGGAQVGSYIVGSTAVDADPTKTNVSLTTDGTTPASVTVTTANYWSVHGLSNQTRSDIGKDSGYIGTNGKSNAYYRGAVFHANLWLYILGAYRQTATGHIWIAPDEDAADAVDALNVSEHIDTGLALPQGTGGIEYGGYIQTLGNVSGLAIPPFCTAGGGSSSAPVGDRVYSPTLATDNTVLRLGGSAGLGAYAGRFYGYWNGSAAHSYWSIGARPILKSP